jgi:regulator of cell morphogenesis and NO signaling
MLTSTQSIREIIIAQSSAAAILQRFDIDLCSRANSSLHQVCTELQLSVDQVLEKLEDAASEHGSAPADLESYSLSRLIQHIVRTHHQYVRRELPRLEAMAHKLAGKHGERTPHLTKVERIIEALRAEMFAHLQKEEQVLFPFIAEMDQDSIAVCSPPQACFRTVAQPVAMMISEHESAESLVAEIRDLTNGFTPPEWACPTHIAFCAGLQDFATNLRQHVQLENDLLFPRAIKLEAELNRRSIR